MPIRSPPLQTRFPRLGRFSNIFDAFHLSSTSHHSTSRIPSRKFRDLQHSRVARPVQYSKREKEMLKISVIDSARQRRLVVEGKLIAPWAVVLKSACERAKVDLGTRELAIELKHVTAISSDGENVILELINEGITIRSHGVFTKHV